MCGVVFAPDHAQRIEADDLGILEVAQAVHVEHDDLAQARQFGSGFERLVELLVVLDEQVDRAGIGAQVLDLHRRIGRIDAVRYPARAEDAHVGIDPFAVGVGEYRSAFARRKAKRHEPHADLARDLAELGPADALPDAEMLLPQTYLRAALRDAAPEHFRHGVDGVSRHRQSFFFFHRRAPLAPAAFMPR